MECGSCLLHLVEHRWSVQDEHLHGRYLMTSVTLTEGDIRRQN